MPHYPEKLRVPQFCLYCSQQRNTLPNSEPCGKPSKSGFYCPDCEEQPPLCLMERWGARSCYARYHDEKDRGTHIPFALSVLPPRSPSPPPWSTSSSVAVSPVPLLRPVPRSPLTPPPPSPPPIEDEPEPEAQREPEPNVGEEEPEPKAGDAQRDAQRPAKMAKVEVKFPWYLRFQPVEKLPEMDVNFLHVLPMVAQSLVMDMKTMVHCGPDVCIQADFRFLNGNTRTPYYQNIQVHLTTLLSYPSLLYQWAYGLSRLEEQLIHGTISPILNDAINQAVRLAAKDDMSVDMLLRHTPQEFRLKEARVKMPAPGYIVAQITLEQDSSLLRRRHFQCCVGILAQYPNQWRIFLAALNADDRPWVMKSVGVIPTTYVEY